MSTAKMIREGGAEIVIDLDNFDAFDAYVLSADPSTLSISEAKRAARIRFNFQFRRASDAKLPSVVCY